MTWILIAAMFMLFLFLLRRPFRQYMPNKRWTAIVFCAAMILLTAFAQVLRRDPISWGFVAYAVVMIVIAITIIKPRDERLLH